MCSDSFNVIERHLLGGVQIIPAEIQIARQQPIRANIGSLAAHRSKCAEMMTERYFFCFHQLLCCNAGLLYFIKNAQDQLLRCLAFLWIKSGTDAKQAWIARRVGEC